MRTVAHALFLMNPLLSATTYRCQPAPRPPKKLSPSCSNDRLGDEDYRDRHLISFPNPKKRTRSYATFACIAILLSGAISQAAMITGKVVSVADGDTITVLDADKTQHKIRLNGIDAPEKAQPFGQLSKQSLSDLVFGKTVQIDANKVDRYGREVGTVMVDGVDANLEQIKRGMAWHYKAYQLEQTVADRAAYAAAEKDAVAASLGLWQDTKPVPPWDWRHRVKPAP